MIEYRYLYRVVCQGLNRSVYEKQALAVAKMIKKKERLLEESKKMSVGQLVEDLLKDRQFVYQALELIGLMVSIDISEEKRIEAALQDDGCLENMIDFINLVKKVGEEFPDIITIEDWSSHWAKYKDDIEEKIKQLNNSLLDVFERLDYLRKKSIRGIIDFYLEPFLKDKLKFK